MKQLITNLINNVYFAQMNNVGLLCNQVSFDFVSQQYLFQILHKKQVLKRLFVPEHGLFGELQDQEKLNEAKAYETLGLDDVDVISLYQNSETSLAPSISALNDLDTIVIDIQDVGCRYFTFTTTIYYLFETLVQNKISPKIFVLNRPNPAGQQIEGTPMPSIYASFIGLEGLPHRHGMTIVELCFYFRERLKGVFEIIVISDEKESNVNPLTINPSPNIPNVITPLIYAGQCLLEGTILSEGRGTTRPFEVFGSPDLPWQDLSKIAEKINQDWHKKAILRPLRFIPTFHKFSGEVCQGFQLHLLEAENYHSLLHSLLIIRELATLRSDIWRTGKYEFGSEKTAIELLVGDDDLLAFLYGNLSYKNIVDKLQTTENQWFMIRNETRLLAKSSVVSS